MPYSRTEFGEPQAFTTDMNASQRSNFCADGLLAKHNCSGWFYRIRYDYPSRESWSD